jgi:energy-coupling factor transporter transmembrane protein EcfT
VTTTQPAAPPRRRVRRETELNFLRLVPRDSVVHRLWAGTKLLVATGLAIVLTISPSWQMLAVATGVVLVGMVAARIPPGAIPRLPGWFFIALAIGAALNLRSGVKPFVYVGGVELSIGGLGEWARFTALTIILVASGALVGWTTQHGDVAPALKRLLRPLRWLRLPVDEWVVAIALAIRCLPLLIDEIRVLNAARRLRSHGADGLKDSSAQSVRELLAETLDLLATAIVTSMRRAHDLGEAMVARGGVGGTVSATRTGPGIVDWFVIVGAAALYVVCLAVLHL